LLTSLSISNYALINSLQTDFTKGLSTVTGETGAGKSILLGALGLVMGNRADLKSLKDPGKKCVVEAAFSIDAYNLQAFFSENDLDYEVETIIRREILVSGKSRAFINDSPVTLSVLSLLAGSLIDIHSQHKTGELSETGFQFQVLDALAQNKAILEAYKDNLTDLKKMRLDLELLLQTQEAAKREYAYHSHLYQELEEADPNLGEQEDLEETLSKLNNAELIKLALSESVHLATDEQMGLQRLLYQLQTSIRKIATFSKEYDDYLKRADSLKIELDDLVFELEKASENADFDPEKIETLNARLQLLYDLQKKHMVTSVEALLQVKDSLEEKVAQVANSSVLIDEKKLAIAKVCEKLEAQSVVLTKNRNLAIPVLIEQLEEILRTLGMKNARFKIELTPATAYTGFGKDNLQFLFSANKGSSFDLLKKVASGGELSRIMIGIKLILSRYIQLPTIIFDEIDTGVSGEVSNKMADFMQEMADFMQVITITHLPQIAAKGASHFKVYKKDIEGITSTFLKKLDFDERVVELAEILGGKTITNSALEHAKELLKVE